MAAEPAQPVPKWWRWTSAEVPADAVGIALRFAVSRNHLDLHGVTASPALAGIARDVRHRTVTLRWPAEGHPAGALTLVAPYAGARPDLAEHRWVRAGDPPAPIAAHPPEELIIERVRRARALPPQAADRDAHVFFAELDAATIPHLERSVEFPEVNAGRLELVARETDRCRDLLLQLAGHRLGRTAPPAWRAAPTDVAAVLPILEPLLERHFGAGPAFDGAACTRAFARFAAGHLAVGQPEPHIRAPDSANFLCFAGFARRALEHPRAAMIWPRAFAAMAKAGAIYLAHATAQPGAGYWDDYGAPRTDGCEWTDEQILAAARMTTADPADLTNAIGRLVARYMKNHVRALFPPRDGHDDAHGVA